jgi:VWFA-related protein
MQTLAVLIPLAGAIAQAPLTLRVNTQLVQFTVVVTDGSGNPVSGLKASDFAVYDNGKKQDVRVFGVEDYLHPRAVSRPAPAIATAPPAPGTFSNRVPMEPGATNPVTVIVIDAGSTWDASRMTWPDLVFARNQLIEFLRQVHPEDRLGIYLLGPRRFWILREYNQTCAELLERLATFRTPAEAPAAAKAPDAWAEFAMHFAGVDAETAKAIHRDEFWTSRPGGGEALPEGLSKDGRSKDGPASTWSRTGNGPFMNPTLFTETASGGAFVTTEQSAPIVALAAVGRHLASVPGRKNLVVISGKMFLPYEYRDQLAVLRPVIRTGVTVYAIDPGGLAPYSLDASFVIPSELNLLTGDTPQAVHQYIRQAEESNRYIVKTLQNSLLTVAAVTGGKAFVNTNGVRDAIRSAFDDSRVTYTLGFYPRTNNDGSYHTIKVKVSGREHLTARYRDGYFEPEGAKNDPKQRESQLQMATWSPVDAAGIALNGTLSAGAAPDTYGLKLKIALTNVSLQSDGNHWNGQIEVDIVGRDNAGNTYDPVSQTLALHLRQEIYDRMMQDGFPYTQSLHVDPKASSLRVIVRDLNGDNLGTVTIPFTKP